MGWAQIVLVLSAAPFGVIGLAFFLQPVAMAGYVGVEVSTPTGDADVRAVYGGLQLGCAVLLALAATDGRWVRAGLVAQLCLYSGLAAARFASYALVGLSSPLGLALHAGEITAVVCGALAWRALSSQE